MIFNLHQHLYLNSECLKLRLDKPTLMEHHHLPTMLPLRLQIMSPPTIPPAMEQGLEFKVNTLMQLENMLLTKSILTLQLILQHILQLPIILLDMLLVLV
jgi:hypothetical protein